MVDLIGPIPKTRFPFSLRMSTASEKLPASSLNIEAGRTERHKGGYRSGESASMIPKSLNLPSNEHIEHTF